MTLFLIITVKDGSYTIGVSSVFGNGEQRIYHLLGISICATHRLDHTGPVGALAWLRVIISRTLIGFVSLSRFH